MVKVSLNHTLKLSDGTSGQLNREKLVHNSILGGAMILAMASHNHTQKLLNGINWLQNKESTKHNIVLGIAI